MTRMFRSTLVLAALIFAGVGSMAAAAVVLLASAPDKARAALTTPAPTCAKPPSWPHAAPPN